MAIDFHQKFATLKEKDVEPLSQEELGYVKLVEDYIDSQIEDKLSTDRAEVWIDKAYVDFNYHPTNNLQFQMTSARKTFLKKELLSRYEKTNWKIDWHIDDGLDGPNMSGRDYLVLKGKLD